MEFDPSFKGPQYLSSLFPRNSYLKPLTQTIFPSQSSIFTPPPPSSVMFHPNNNSHHFQDHIMNVPTNSTPFVMEGPSNPITTPMYGITTPSLGDGSSLGGFVNVQCHPPMMLAPNNNNKMEALYGQDKGKAISDFSQKTMLCSSEDSSSKSPSPFSLPNDWWMSQYHWDTDQKVKVEKDSNIGNDNVIKGKWSMKEDRDLIELVNQYGLKKWSQIAKLLHCRTGKQCQERWNNHLQPNIRKDSWTLKEDKIFIETHIKVGNKWSEIAKMLPGRAPNTIKNRWNGSKRRKNDKRQNKNKHGPYDGSVLDAYVKMVTATEETT
ncbi:Transcription factor MYB119 [Glycine soja]|uniref:Uncharacterized protein n=1 Tax=Glycine max TaxID=3847 RepID=A0A0R0K6Z5_SOYBN|eukprot:XP_006576590.2 transcription factor MYB3R-2 [Glycine max]